eukprot:5481422-Prymnesium_polylepis.1
MSLRGHMGLSCCALAITYKGLSCCALAISHPLNLIPVLAHRLEAEEEFDALLLHAIATTWPNDVQGRVFYAKQHKPGQSELAKDPAGPAAPPPHAHMVLPRSKLAIEHVHREQGYLLPERRLQLGVALIILLNPSTWEILGFRTGFYPP